MAGSSLPGCGSDVGRSLFYVTVHYHQGVPFLLHDNVARFDASSYARVLLLDRSHRILQPTRCAIVSDQMRTGMEICSCQTQRGPPERMSRLGILKCLALRRRQAAAGRVWGLASRLS